MTQFYPAQFQETFIEQDVPESGYGDVRHNFSNGFVVTFRDIPEANTQGFTYEEAVEMAEDALSLVLFGYEEDGIPQPDIKPIQTGDVMIKVTTLKTEDVNGCQ